MQEFFCKEPKPYFCAIPLLKGFFFLLIEHCCRCDENNSPILIETAYQPQYIIN